VLRRALASLALAACLALAAACVVWPAGTGPGAEPVPLAEAIDRRDRGEVVIVDVREPGAFAAGHIPGAINVPLDGLAGRVGELRRLHRLPVLYCGCPHESSSLRAARILHTNGLDARVLAGGYSGYLREPRAGPP
jgi:rhodanese-related sulfurtransferase